MARSNCTSPGRGTVASIQNQHKTGQVNTLSSETSGNENKGRPGLKIEFA